MSQLSRERVAKAGVQRRGLEIEERGGAEGRVALVLAGELDIASAPRLQKAVERLCANELLSELTIDLQGLEFIDSTGLAAVVFASRLCESRGRELALIRGPDVVQQVFALTGLLDELPFRSAEEARAPD
jgi:anti-sigma B factor antagonist